MDQPVPPPATILACAAGDVARRLDEFAEVLHACVRDGASIGFVQPCGRTEAAAFWREMILPPLAAGGRLLLAAEAGGRLAGTVQLIHDTLPNQPPRRRHGAALHGARLPDHRGHPRPVRPYRRPRPPRRHHHHVQAAVATGTQRPHCAAWLVPSAAIRASSLAR